MIAHKFGYNKQKGKATTVCNSDVAKLIQTSEHHTSEMVKMKEQLFRKFKESEKMQEANKIALENGFRTEDGKLDFMITLQEENEKLSQIIKEENKLSHIITLDSTLEKTFDPPLECKNCEIALLELDFESAKQFWPFVVDKTNNIIEYKYDIGKWGKLEIEEGCYNDITLGEYVNTHFSRYVATVDEWVKLFQLQSSNYTVEMKLFSGASVRFTHPNSVGKLLGFSKEYTAHTNTSFLADKKHPKFYGKINIHLNCLQNGFENQQESSFIYSFTNRRNEVTGNPNVLAYFPLKDKITDFKVEVKDNYNNNLCFDNFQLKFHIKK